METNRNHDTSCGFLYMYLETLNMMKQMASEKCTYMYIVVCVLKQEIKLFSDISFSLPLCLSPSFFQFHSLSPSFYPLIKRKNTYKCSCVLVHVYFKAIPFYMTVFQNDFVVLGFLGTFFFGFN